MFNQLKAMTQCYYEEALKQFGDDPRGVNWSNVESQRLRFSVLTEIGDLNGKRVHDLGCGLAHYRDYLLAAGIAAQYVGSDISGRMIEAARQRLGEGVELHVGDVLADHQPWMEADYVVNSGIFTVRNGVDEEEWWFFVSAMLERMFALARVGISFNLMTSYVDFRDDKLFYKSAQETLDFCVRRLSRRVVIRHDYPLWEYTTYVYK